MSIPTQTQVLPKEDDQSQEEVLLEEGKGEQTEGEHKDEPGEQEVQDEGASQSTHSHRSSGRRKKLTLKAQEAQALKERKRMKPGPVPPTRRSKRKDKDTGWS